MFETPRPAPGRLLPAIAAAGLFLLALPVFVVADLPLGGWVLAVVLWLAVAGPLAPAGAARRRRR